jgi:hypothetical protein
MPVVWMGPAFPVDADSMLPFRSFHNAQEYLTSFIPFVVYRISILFACFNKPLVDPAISTAATLSP